MRTIKRLIAVGLITGLIVLVAQISDLKDSNQQLNRQLNKMKKLNIKIKKLNKKLKIRNKGLENKLAVAKKTTPAAKKWLAHQYPAKIYSGFASWYSYGKRTATGEAFNPNGYTMATMNRGLFGKRAKVTNLANGKSVIVKINDTGNFARLGRIADLSRGAFSKIASLGSGVVKIKLEILA